MQKKNTASINKLPPSAKNSAYTTELARLRYLFFSEPGNLTHCLNIAELHLSYNENKLAKLSYLDIIKLKLKISSVNIVFMYNVYRGLAKACEHEGETQLAVKYLEETTKLINNNSHHLKDYSIPLAENLKDIGILHLNNNQLENALSNFLEAFSSLDEKTKDSPSYDEYIFVKTKLYESRATTYFQLGNMEQALNDRIQLITEYESDCVKFANKIGLNYFQIGQIHQQLDNEPEIMNAFNSAIMESSRHACPLESNVLVVINRFATQYYLKSGAYEISLLYAKNLLESESDPLHKAAACHSAANCYLLMGLIDETMACSIQALTLTEPTKNTHPIPFADSCITSANAFCLSNKFIESLIKCKEAISYYQNALNESESSISVMLRLKIASAHKLKADMLLHGPNLQKNDYNQAFKSYKTALIEKDFQTGGIYFKQAYCLSNLDEPNKAIASYENALSKYNKSMNITAPPSSQGACDEGSLDFNCAFIHIKLAKIFNTKNDVSKTELHITKALAILEKTEHNQTSVLFDGFAIACDWKYEIAFLRLLLADIFSKKARFSEAEPHYAYGLNHPWLQTPNNYREYASCLNLLKKPYEAILGYQKSMENNPTRSDLQHALFSLGKLYIENTELENHDVNAEKNFLLALSHFPQHENKDDKAQANALPPETYFLIHFYLGDIYLKRGDNISLAQHHYIAGLNAPAYQVAKNYYTLGFMYYISNDFSDADKYFDLALEHLENNPDQTVTVEQILMAKEDVQTKMNMKPKYVTLPPVIKKIFQEISSIYPNVYLGGSTIHTLLNKSPLNANQDLDFLALGEPTNRLETELNFRTCSFNGILYQKNEEIFSIDCYIKQQVDALNPSKNLASSDYTVAGLYCDKDGKIYDQSGHGIDDFFAKRLRSINAPVEMFQLDPVCLLRGIKLQGRGFKPTMTLDKAMMEYVPSATDNKHHHLCAITRGLIKSLPTRDLVSHLSRYGLFGKLFAMSDHLTDEGALLQLRNRIKSPSPTNGYSNSFLNTFSRVSSPSENGEEREMSNNDFPSSKR